MAASSRAVLVTEERHDAVASIREFVVGYQAASLKQALVPLASGVAARYVVSRALGGR